MSNQLQLPPDCEDDYRDQQKRLRRVAPLGKVIHRVKANPVEFLSRMARSLKGYLDASLYRRRLGRLTVGEVAIWCHEITGEDAAKWEFMIVDRGYHFMRALVKSIDDYAGLSEPPDNAGAWLMWSARMYMEEEGHEWKVRK